ncbi:hypothetical protein G4B88_025771 [Cannabis sativa]|uniref:Uncharacterized protein n=1 Tax=Cannabis sativa TaxID=3483 RepID=A0A7J6DN61_CANSA|nr:hypothetical protein G4B88_025771 [Cannabis sativa]
MSDALGDHISIILDNTGATNHSHALSCKNVYTFVVIFLCPAKSSTSNTGFEGPYDVSSILWSAKKPSVVICGLDLVVLENGMRFGVGPLGLFQVAWGLGRVSTTKLVKVLRRPVVAVGRIFILSYNLRFYLSFSSLTLASRRVRRVDPPLGLDVALVGGFPLERMDGGACDLGLSMLVESLHSHGFVGQRSSIEGRGSDVLRNFLFG